MIDPGVLIDGEWNPSSSNSSFVVSNSFTNKFSNMESNSVAAPLMDFEGDDMRLIAGKTNKSSSFVTSDVSLLAYSEKSQASLYVQQYGSKVESVERNFLILTAKRRRCENINNRY